MSRIVIADPRSGRGFETDFPSLVEVLKGATVINLADSDRFVELGLSEDLLLRAEVGDLGTLQLTVVSTLNPGEIRPARLRLIEDGEEPSAARIEQRLHSLRQVYAIVFLLNAGREEELADAVRDDPSVDIEQKLLGDDERLCLQAAGPGSWWITVVTKVKGVVGQRTLNTLSLFYSEGRDLLMARVQSGTALIQEDVVRKQIENDKARMQAAIELATKYEKIKNPETRELVRNLLISNTSSINSKSAALLPPPDSSH